MVRDKLWLLILHILYHFRAHRYVRSIVLIYDFVADPDIH